MGEQLIESYQIRPAATDDLEAMTELERAYEMALYGESETELEELQIIASSPNFDLSQQGHLVFDQSGRLICTAVFFQFSHVRYNLHVTFLPGHENSALFARLIDLGEAWARQDMAKAPAEARVVARNWVPGVDAMMNGWYRNRADYREIRRFREMQIDLLEAPQQPSWPAGVELRPFVPARDARAVYEADEAIFQDHWGHLSHNYDLWLHWSIERESFDPSLWFVAWAGDEIAGLSLCRDSQNGWVDTLGVARPWRGKGLGLALLHHSFGEFYRRGKRRIALGVDGQSLTGATRLYERAGMHIAKENITYEKELRAGIDLSVQTLTS